jgi:SAM-dependent methyltransferase
VSTDEAWEEWGRRDPYFGVITDPKYRSGSISQEARNEFFASGRVHADHVMLMIKHYIDPNFAPRSVLDFGCGVGRVLFAFAKAIPEAVGLDVSPSMLAEAKRNAERFGFDNLQLATGYEGLATPSQRFDLVHSFIVFQHIPARRGREIFAQLLARIAPGGVGAIHLVYSKSRYAPLNGAIPAEELDPPPPVAPPVEAPEATRAPPADASPPGPPPDPEMQMNAYPMNEILFALQGAGVPRFHADFTDHGGELGVFLFFRVPG